ncbi:tetratricopeptide repeat-containing sensor histidine kinase [Olivibacter jilunii]|uniref:tetratricopeptide repeat-containing sensor histidine kinase n=1 Tax=Olivibacter jilunii TaxID=985016 RepID=UPI0010304DBC|nr:tetratricopeptide repeat protein [Olivibacter jilunii]
MKPVLIFFMMLLVGLQGFSQQLQREIDSLNLLLTQNLQQDTVRVILLTELAFNYHYTDPDKGLQRAKEAEELAGELHFLRGMAMAYSRMGINYWAKGQDSLAMLATGKALDIYRESGNRLSYAKTLNNRALNYFALGEYAEALRDHEDALEVFRSLDYPAGIRHSYNNIGTVFMTINDYRRAMDAYVAGLKVNRPEDKGLEANLLSNIGLVLKNQRQYRKALDYEQRALRLYEQQGNQRGLALCYANIGSLHDFLKQPQQALEYYNRSLDLNKKAGDAYGIASDKTNIGITLRDMGEPEASLAYLQEAVGAYRNLDDKGNQSLALIALAAAKGSLARNREEKIEVLKLQQEALKLAEESKVPLRESEALGAVSKTYEALGRYREALEMYRRHVTVNDTIFNEEKTREITRKQVSFEFEKEQAVAHAEIRRQKMIRNATMLGGSGVLLASVAAFVFYKRRKDLKIQKQEAEYKALVAETELQVLRSQLNPHFIFNSLNSIGDYMVNKGSRESQDYLADFARLMRMTLEYSYQSEIPLREDLSFLTLYLELEKRRLANQLFDYRIEVADNVDQDNVMVPPLLLQPFIENSIKHGFAFTEVAGLVRISINKDNQQLVCSIDDNGTGIKNKEDRGNRKSRGLSISEKRVALFARQHKGQGHMKLIDKQEVQGTRIEVNLPLVFRF